MIAFVNTMPANAKTNPDAPADVPDCGKERTLAKTATTKGATMIKRVFVIRGSGENVWASVT